VDILVIQIVIGLIAVILFRYKNPQRDLIDIVSIFVLILFLSRALIEVTDWGFYFWITTALGLVTTYTLRFFKKKHINLFDGFKLVGIISLTLYPLSAYRFEGQFETVEYYLENLILPTLGTLYIYDRLILKTEMKKRYIIILSIQSFLILLMLTYSIIQKAEADKQVMRAESERTRAEKLEYELTKIRAEKENDRQQ
jgi:hypothetical protein